MVLQRAPESARVFGSVCGGLANATSVSVDVDGGAPTTVPIVAGATSWAVSLPPQPASLAPHTLRVRGGESFVQTIDDVLFGDVILCSGQSNMVFSVNQMTGARDEIARANASRFRAIRLFTVAPRTASAPAADPVVMQPWQLANSESVGGGAASVAFTYFSAVCWLQGSHLFDRLGGSVPLGLITSAVGGTRIHCWSSPDALGQCPQYLPPRAVSSGDSDLFNSMIAPLLSMRLKFIVWLQSESDVCASDASCIPQRGARYYSCAIQAMVRDWRAKFNATSPALPFIWVQIAPWEGHEAATTSRALPAMRLAQMAANALPRVAMATAVDLGSAANAKGWNTGDEHGPDPWGNVHFRRKGPLGPRLSAAALAVVYGNASVPYRGPEAERVSTIARPCEVSVRLCTVTYYANRAHNLTRSP
jgi:sialate O-acetylesterase